MSAIHTTLPLNIPDIKREYDEQCGVHEQCFKKKCVSYVQSTLVRQGTQRIFLTRYKGQLRGSVIIFSFF